MIVVKAHHPKHGQLVKVCWSESELKELLAKLTREGWKDGLR